MKYEQRCIILIFLKYDTVRLKSEPLKNPEISWNSKTKKSTAKLLFWCNSF